MQMSHVESTFNIALLALAAGGFLIYLGKKEKFCGVRRLGCAIALLAILSMSCTIFWGYRYWSAGIFDAPIEHAKSGGMMNCPMMDGMMKNGMMMKGGMPMNEDTTKPAPSNPKSEDHNAHH